MSIQERLLESRDFRAVYNIYFHPDVIDFLGYDPLSLDSFKPIFEEYRSSGEFLVFELKSQIIGFCKVHVLPGRAKHVAYLGPFALHPEYFGRGYGQQIIKTILESLIQKNIIRVELMVEEDNPRAIKFYEKLGFQKEATLKKYYKRSHQNHYVDEHLMSIFLN